ncbi:MAG: collagen-like protein [Actinomycetota bacterium]|nr:collagen-like protein [Actinomycetota bacterium]
MKRLFRPGRYANVTATMALVVALGGTSYAAVSLPKNSVGSKQIRKNAVSSSKVKNRSLLSKDFKAGQLPRGPQGLPGQRGAPGTPGAPGAPGASGAPGTARAYGTVNANGTLDATQSKNIASVTHPDPGIYCITPSGFDPTDVSAVATLNANPGFVSNAEIYIETSPVTCADDEIQVLTRRQSIVAGPTLDSTNTDAGFFFVVP